VNAGLNPACGRGTTADCACDTDETLDGAKKEKAAAEHTNKRN
jgi:hypothetical protein